MRRQYLLFLLLGAFGIGVVAGLRSLKLHALRHTYASLLLQDRESPAYVKEQMGHSSIQVTVDLYCHWIPGSNRQAVDRLDETVDIQKLGGQSATIRNQIPIGQREEERFPLQALGNYGAGDLDRTGDLRFTNG